jgi:hypothetical protein
VPLSLAVARAGVPGTAGVTLTLMVRVALDAPSLTWIWKLSVPA